MPRRLRRLYVSASALGNYCACQNKFLLSREWKPIGIEEPAPYRTPNGVMMDGVNLGRIGTLVGAARKNQVAPFKAFYKALATFDTTGDPKKAAVAGATASGKRKGKKKNAKKAT